AMLVQHHSHKNQSAIMVLKNQMMKLPSKLICVRLVSKTKADTNVLSAFFNRAVSPASIIIRLSIHVTEKSRRLLRLRCLYPR
ncbi:MAG: hypothetical protein ACK55Z_03115, partial [bacterium]